MIHVIVSGKILTRKNHFWEQSESGSDLFLTRYWAPRKKSNFIIYTACWSQPTSPLYLEIFRRSDNLRYLTNYKSCYIAIIRSTTAYTTTGMRNKQSTNPNDNLDFNKKNSQPQGKMKEFSSYLGRIIQQEKNVL